jgi:N-acetylated-alpha-linked acidic dipeptidase
VHHAGVASVNLGFGGEDTEGIYHSVYDDPTWYAKYSDADFKYGKALAQLAGLTVMRLADAELIPLDFEGQADTLQKHAGDVKKLLDGKREETKERIAQLDEGAYAAASDPKNPIHAPAREALPPHLNWAPLENAVDALETAAARYRAAVGRFAGKPLPEEQLATWNKSLLGAEQRLLDPAGLPGRPWYRNLAYAPGAYTGYAAAPFPGVREAIELRKFPEAETEIARLAKVIDDEARAVDALAQEIEKAAPAK